jgi:DNA-binding protein, stimulates sugar fermentation
MIMVLVMRRDASCFSPNWETDPGFSEALWRPWAGEWR